MPGRPGTGFVGFEEGLLLGRSGRVGGAAPSSCVFGYVPVVAFAFEALPPFILPFEAFEAPFRLLDVLADCSCILCCSIPC